MRELKAQSADIGMRADIFVAGRYPAFSRSSLAGLFDSGKVRLADEPIRPSYKLHNGDRLSVDDELLYRKSPAISLPVIYEDDDVLVIDKPAGVLSHSKGALNLEGTVASFILKKLDKDLAKTNRAGIVHRLDRKTSGVMITARNQAALAWLQKQFSTRKTKKTYLAVVEGVPEPPEAIIDAPIARNPKKPQTFMVSPGGKTAQTRYKLLENFQIGTKNYSLLEIQPLTGRTHQIRVHLAYTNHPIVGDHVYGRDGQHLLLHAKSLELTLPNRRRQTFTAELPEYFKDFQNDGR